MKVLLVTHRWRGGGAEEVARVWTAALVMAGYLVEVLILAPETPGEEQMDLAVEVHRVQQPGFLARAKVLRDIVNERQVDVVLCLQTYANLLGLTARMMGFGAAVVISEHNLPSVYLAKGSVGHRIQEHIARILYRYASFSIAVSHAVATDLIVRYSVKQDKCAVIPNGVVSGLSLHPLAEPPSGSSVPRKISIIVPARLSWQKRPERAAEIVEELTHRGRNVELLWIGDPVAGESDVYTAARGRFEVQEWRDNWWSGVPEDAIVLLPSTIEGLGNVLLQAAAHGFMSVAGSSALGTGDAIVPGVTGYLAATDSVRAFADAIELAAGAGRERTLDAWFEHHSVTRTAALLRQVLESL